VNNRGDPIWQVNQKENLAPVQAITLDAPARAFSYDTTRWKRAVFVAKEKLRNFSSFWKNAKELRF
jgi:hypothetical protein